MANVRDEEKIYYTRLLSHVRGKISGDPKSTTAFENMGCLHNLIDSLGKNLLHYSAQEGDASTTRWLINYGLDVNSQTKSGITPLMLATSADHEETVCVLLKANANINLVDASGKKVLQKLSRSLNGSSAILGALLMKVVDKCETVEEAAINLFAAKCPNNIFVLFKNKKITEIFLKRRLTNKNVRRVEPPALHLAVYYQHLDSVKLFLQYGDDVNSKDIRGLTPLSYIPTTPYCKDDHLEILKVLINQGANLTAIQELTGSTSIHNILKRFDKETIQFVLQQSGIGLHVKDEFGYNLLHYLACNANPNVFEVLLPYKNVDIDAKNIHGQTALHLAARYGHYDTLQFLLSRGADVNAKDEVPGTSGRTPLFYTIKSRPLIIQAVQNRIVKCVELLLQYEADPQITILSSELTIFDLIHMKETLYLIEPILAQLAISNASGTTITEKIIKKVNSDEQLNNLFNLYKKQLEQFKKTVIFESLTMFDLLTVSESKLLLYLRNQELYLNWEVIDHQNNQDGYYYRKLRERIESAFQKVQLRRNAATALCKIMQFFYASQPIAVDEILSYLSEQDLLRLTQIYAFSSPKQGFFA